MGELARKPGCPTLAETPLELLTPRPGENYWAFERQCWAVTGGALGLLSSLLINVSLKRPLWATLPRHILMPAGASYVTTFIVDSLYASKAEEDAVFKHYISLHPEDFPPFERKRWGEVYAPFKPIR